MIKIKNADSKIISHFVGRGRYAKHAKDTDSILYSPPETAYN
jgi:hypothetical protein